jgi:hypothetical protein
MTKITTEHLARNARVYIRQSTADQLAHKRGQTTALILAVAVVSSAVKVS